MSSQIISNIDFLQGIFGSRWRQAHCTAFADPPNQPGTPGVWAGQPWKEKPISTAEWEHLNEYVCISLFRKDSQNRARRKRDLYEQCYLIAIDDIGPKIDPPKLAPSYRLETSPGNEQWGYILRPGFDGIGYSETLIDSFLESLVAKLTDGGTDPGMRSTTRYIRLPEGWNTKSTLHEKFKCQLKSWHPERKFLLETLAGAFGVTIDLSADNRLVRDDFTKETFGLAAHLPEHPARKMVKILRDRGDGQLDIVCPWALQHSDRDISGTAIWTYPNGHCGFRCHHGHCAERTSIDFNTFVTQSPEYHKALLDYQPPSQIVPRKEPGALDDFDFNRIVPGRMRSENVVIPSELRPGEKVFQNFYSALARSGHFFRRNSLQDAEYPASTGELSVQSNAILFLDYTPGKRDIHTTPCNAATFSTVLSHAGTFVTAKTDRQGATVFVRCNLPPESISKCLISSPQARMLPVLNCLINTPVIRPNGQLYYRAGYYPELDGAYITPRAERIWTSVRAQVERLTLHEAVLALKGILADYNFVSEADHSRAFGFLLSPALVRGRFFTSAPVMDISEADMSQAGKSFRHTLIREIYHDARGEQNLTHKKGVGSVEENIGNTYEQADGFATFDNVKGVIDSPLLESILTASRPMRLRIFRGLETVDVRYISAQFSTNAATLTPDLINRSLVVRIRKQPVDYAFKTYPEGDLEKHIARHKGFYLACIYRIVREWITAGMPRNVADRSHNRRDWFQKVDGLVRFCGLTGMLPRGDRQNSHNQILEEFQNHYTAIHWLRRIGLHVTQTEIDGEVEIEPGYCSSTSTLDVLHDYLDNFEDDGDHEKAQCNWPAARRKAQYLNSPLHWSDAGDFVKDTAVQSLLADEGNGTVPGVPLIVLLNWNLISSPSDRGRVEVPLEGAKGMEMRRVEAIMKGLITRQRGTLTRLGRTRITRQTVFTRTEIPFADISIIEWEYRCNNRREKRYEFKRGKGYHNN